jgi:hypothetical protein
MDSNRNQEVANSKQRSIDEWIAIQKKKSLKLITTHSDHPEKLYEEYAAICEDAANQWGDTHFPVWFLEMTIRALKSQNWTEVGQAFVSEQFFHDSGYFILAGPYSVLRKGVRTAFPTLIIGKVLKKMHTEHLCALADELFEKRGEKINSLIPIEVLVSCGYAGNESGEAFLVPDGWLFPKSEQGPALNDMKEQRRRFEDSAKICIETIFEKTSAALLIEAFEASEPWYALQHREFLYHEIGHTTGLGLKRKLAGNWLTTPWYRAVEEWRSDGVEFELLARTLSPSDAGKTLAANLVLRFGVDSQRMGGIERDTDVSASLLTFDRLMEAGFLKIGKSRKLEFAVPTYQRLLASTELHRFDAVRLTHDEIALTYPEGLWSLYGSVKVSRGARNLFQGLVIDPCLGKFSTLN